jgi:hypothetical protein
MGTFTVKATIDFESSATIRITTPFRQKTFSVVAGKCIDLEKLVELKRNGLKILPTDFYIIMYDHNSGSLKDRYSYEVLALTSAKHHDVVAAFNHQETTKIEVKIFKP